VRSLALVPDIGFASGSNDRSVREWFAYAMLTPSSDIVKLQYGRLKETWFTCSQLTRLSCIPYRYFLMAM
jgi:hypothetical protein